MILDNIFYHCFNSTEERKKEEQLNFTDGTAAVIENYFAQDKAQTPVADVGLSVCK